MVVVYAAQVGQWWLCNCSTLPPHPLKETPPPTPNAEWCLYIAQVGGCGYRTGGWWWWCIIARPFLTPHMMPAPAPPLREPQVPCPPPMHVVRWLAPVAAPGAVLWLLPQQLSSRRLFAAGLALITTCWGRSPHRAEQAALLAQWADYGRVRQLWRQDVDGRGLDPVCCLIMPAA